MKMLILLVVSFLMTSCSLLEPVKLPEQQRFVLTDLNPTVQSKAHTNLTLLVSQLSANPGFRSEDIVYMNSAYQLKSFAKSNWIASPADMLLPLITQSLRNTHYFHAVLESPFAGLTDLRLDTQLLIFQQEFIGTQSRVKLAIQATLVDSRRQSVIASKTLSAIIPSGNNPYSGVLAANKATSLVLKQLSQFVLASKIPLH